MSPLDISIVLGAFLGYTVLLVTSHGFLGEGTMILSVLPVMAAGWFLGIRGGIGGAVLALPINLVFVVAVENAGLLSWVQGGGGFGTAGLLAVGALLGRSRDLMGRAGYEIARYREAEDTLRASEELYRVVVENVAEGIAINIDAKRVFVNKAYLDIHGLQDVSQVVGKPLSQFIHPEDREYVVARSLARQRGEPTLSSYEYRFLRTDGEVRTVQTLAVPLQYRGQSATLAVIRDVTEEKRAEEALRESEELHRAIVENVNEGITINRDGKRVFINKAFLDIHGLQDASQVIGKPLEQFIVPEDREGVLARNLARQRGEPVPISGEHRILRSDGEVRTVQTSAVLLQYMGQPATLGVLRDVTEEKRAEETLRDSESRLAGILGMGEEAIISIDEAQNIILFNWGAEKIFGYSSQEVLGKPLDILIPARFAEVYDSHIKSFAMAGDNARRMEERSDIFGRRKDGTEFPAEASIWKLGRDGEETFSVLLRDVTERKKAEDKLRESEELYRVVVENVAEAITISIDAKRVFINKAFLDIHGLKDISQVIGESIDQFIVPEDKEFVVARNMARQRGESVPFFYEYRILRSDGEVRTVQILAVPLQYRGQAATLAVIRDVTEQKRAEEERARSAKALEETLRDLQVTQQQLIQSEKLAAIGQLVSGVAHELNNPLTGVWGTAQLIMRREIDENLREDLEVIQQEASRAVKIVQNLLSFAREHKSEKRLASINEALERTLELRAYEMKTSGIELEVELQPDFPETRFDFHQMQQVFMNIIVNAEQAMSGAHGGGKLLVRTEKGDGKIKISFTDNGPGIKRENQAKVFDPFFTTKEVGRGTGLGLSICYGIVLDHGGSLSLESEVGKGTTFTVEIPITGEEGK
jgi:two-component system NtrC family sensor kinase